jgi:hypothetical protein
MSSLKRGLSIVFLLVFTITATVIPMAYVNAQITNPSIPEFAVKYIDASYNTPTTYSTDPYTGSTVTHQSQHIVNRTIELTIKNQPFTKYESDGQIINFYLNVRTKGSYDKDWITIYTTDNGYLTPSNSTYSKVTYSLDDNTPPFWDNIQGGGSVDFQVQALIGSIHRAYDPNATPPFVYPWLFFGQTSDWSNTQTIHIPTSTNQSPTLTQTASTNTPNMTTTNSFQVNDLVIIVVAVSAVIIIVIVAVAAVLVSRAKKSTG